ncbi:MAG: sigma-54-dependent Fis family transcriptional regulator [Planctomycetes bacterium]|nr:sigma-54-dependent Fis family transcriptional regulator [Planctomycetota bacterium]
MSDWAREQAIRFAGDLGRVYAEAEEDRRRVGAIAEISLDLARSVSLEAAALRLCGAGVGILGLSCAAVYLRRKEKTVRQACHPKSGGPQLGPKASDLESLSGRVAEFDSTPWTSLFPEGDPVTVIPLVGRGGSIGFLVGAGRISQLEGPSKGSYQDLLTLLAGHAGVIFENFLFEERRGASLRPKSTRRSAETARAPLALLGTSPAMQEILGMIDRLAKVDSSVLLGGETGTGKSLVARAIHDASPRADRPFIALNCAAIPDALVESELFGHEAGAFTGAQRQHRGKVEQAEGGTLFLDEVGELSLGAQSKLLTFLEEHRFARVGGSKELQVDVRVLSATNADLEAAVQESAFRNDLLYRLNVFVLELPPLRARGADITTLAQHFAQEVAERYSLPLPAFGSQAQARLLAYHWPGNVRELRNVMERAIIMADGGPIPAELLPAGQNPLSESPVLEPDTPPVAQPPSLDQGVGFADAKREMIQRWEIAYLLAALKTTGGNVAHAARLAKIDKKNLQRKIKGYGIDIQGIRAGRARGGPGTPATS